MKTSDENCAEPLKAVLAKVAAYDKQLLASDPRFQRRATLIHDDGSVLHFDSAFLLRVDVDWIAVFTEHHGYTVYHDSDLVSFEQTMPIIDVEALNPDDIKGG